VITDAIARELSGFVWVIAKQTKARSWNFPRHVADRLAQLFLTQKEIVTDPRRETGSSMPPRSADAATRRRPFLTGG
jgi:hypothetical protein